MEFTSMAENKVHVLLASSLPLFSVAQREIYDLPVAHAAWCVIDAMEGIPSVHTRTVSTLGLSVS